MITDIKNKSEENPITKSIKSYINKEQKYLECLYFQVLRNSKNEDFTESNLNKVLNFSIYLRERIFKLMTLKNNSIENPKAISLESFIQVLRKLFTKYYLKSNEEAIKIELLYDLIFIKTDSHLETSFSSITEFLNNIVFEASNKAKIEYFHVFQLTCTNAKKLFKNAFKESDPLFSKSSIIDKQLFCKTLGKNRLLFNLIVFILNLISPLNENLLHKINNKDYILHSNDDFEPESEVEELIEQTPRANLCKIPPPNLLLLYQKTNVLFGNKTLKNSANFNIENKNHEEQNALSDVSYYNATRKTATKRACDNCNPSLKSEKVIRSDSDDTTVNINNRNNNENVNCTTKIINYSNKVNSLKKAKIVNILQEVKTKEISKRKNIFGKKNEDYKSILVDNEINEKKDHNKKFVSCPGFVKSQAKGYLTDDTIDEFSDCERTSLNNNNIRNNINYINDKYFKNNAISINLNFIKEIKEEYKGMYEGLFLIYSKIKSAQSFQNIKNKFEIIFHKENPKTNTIKEDSLEKLLDCSFNAHLKILENEILLWKINSAAKKSEANNEKQKNSKFVYFYRIQNAIFEPLPQKQNCVIFLKKGSNQKRYFYLKGKFESQNYKFFFESYEDLVCFTKITDSLKHHYQNTFANVYKTKNKNFEIIQSAVCFEKYTKKFSYVHEILKAHDSYFSIKLQTFKKSYLTEENEIFLTEMFSLCRLNNFLNINLIPVINIYENEGFYVVEFSSDNFIFDYDLKDNNFTFTIDNMKLCDLFKSEVEKFRKLIKMLNIGKKLYELFSLLKLQK